jgi:two-component system, LuxR family, sensor kinase FixL
MSWTTIAWSMGASACFTLAIVHLVIWCKQTDQRAHLLFSVTAISVAAITACELIVMHAQSPEQLGRAIWWAHIPVFFAVVSIVGFVRLYFNAGRPWLGYAVCGLRLLDLIINFFSMPNANYERITGLRHVTIFGGETISLAQGVENPWVRVSELSSLLLLVFLVDASATLWRRGDPGERRRAVIVGGSMIFFISVAAGTSALIEAAVMQSPYLISFSFLAIVMAMGYELSLDVVRAAQLARQLQASEAAFRESEQRLSLAADAGNLGIWIRDLAGDEIWATDKWRELFGFEKSESLNMHRFLQRLHPGDRDAVQALTKALEGGGDYEKEYRIILPDGRIRWIASRGRVEFDAAGKPVLMRGASLDNTARKLAEEAAHDLSGRLIHAQEEEQMRLARELHDDLSQSLALLSVELEMFGQSPPSAVGQISGRMQEFSAQVKRLSSEVHRLSHEMHPAKLEQLGLVAAVRGFCKEFAGAHEMASEFTDRSVPREVPEDTALCLYRIAQEALHNVVKHSGATAARVELAMEGSELRLAIADDGVGFDPEVMCANGSLGLVSMRERARFLHGRLSIESHAGKGTRVEARVPIAEADDLS